MKNPNEPQTLSPFGQTVEAALKNYSDTSKLAESPLAAPYLLAHHLDPQTTSAEERGKTLKRLLEEAAQAMKGNHKASYQTIIQERYFYDQPEVSIYPLINLQKVAYHKYRKEAIEQLATILMQRLNPSLLLEGPPKVQDVRLFGINRALQPYLQKLEDNQMLLITGGGGVGKTTLGSQLAQSWNKTCTFWFTVRPGLNDHINSLLFALGYFLKTLGEPVLWQEVIAQQRNIETTSATAIVRQALQNLRERTIKPLLCFDELDLLQSAQQGEHAQLLAFIGSLRTEVAILVMGQQVLLEAHSFCTLEDLSFAETQQMLAAADIRLNASESQFIHTYTHGNPRLIELFITLQRDEAMTNSKPTIDGKAVIALFQRTQNTPPLEFFLDRIIRRLEPAECAILKALAVFRTPAPADLWQNKTMGWAFNRLRQRRLVLADQMGCVTILSVYRTIIYNLLASQDRLELHKTAAEIRAGRAAYTAAAYHWIQAGQPEKALLQWRLFLIH